MTTFQKFLKKHLETHPAFAERWRGNKPWRDIVAAIIKARIDQKLTQADVAAKAKISLNDVNSLETGNGKPIGVKRMVKIADALGLKMILVNKDDPLYTIRPAANKQ